MASELADHFREGRLDQSEFDERLGLALSARTRGELSGLLTDLPSSQRGMPSRPSRAHPAGTERWRGRPFPVVPVAALILLVAVFTAATAAHGGRHLWIPWWLILPAIVMARRWWRGGRTTGGGR